jgi:hypothetical protein
MALFANIGFEWGRLLQRFRVERSEGDPEPLRLLTTIQPVTSLDAILTTVVYKNAALDLSGVSGTTIVLYTVPLGRRATLRMYRKRFPSTACEGRITNPDGDRVIIAEHGTALEYEKSLAIPMTEGTTFGYSGTGDGADNARAMICVVDESIAP